MVSQASALSRLARDRENARQPGEPVAAKRVVDQLVGDDAGVVRTVSDAGERRVAEGPCIADAEPHRARGRTKFKSCPSRCGYAAPAGDQDVDRGDRPVCHSET